MEILLAATITRSPKVIETTVGSETVLMMIETGECIGLGETGSEVWRRLATPLSITALVEQLRAIHDAPADVIEKDVDELLRKLRGHNLISIE